MYSERGFCLSEISEFLKTISYLYDDFCYNNNLEDKMISLERYLKYGRFAYSEKGLVNNSSILNIDNNRNLLTSHKIIGNIPKNINEIMLPKEKYYEYFESNQENALIKNFFLNYKDGFPCVENKYFDKIVVTGYYETIYQNNDIKNKFADKQIIISDALYNQLYYDKVTNPYLIEILQFVGDCKLLRNIEDYIKNENVDLYDNGLYYSITSSQVVVNYFYMISTFLGLILFVVCIICILSFYKNYEEANNKNIFKLIFSGFNINKLLLISFSVIMLYFLLPIGIALSLCFIINELIAKFIVKLNIHINFNISFFYSKIYLITIFILFLLLLLMVIFLLIKNKIFKHKIEELFK